MSTSYVEEVTKRYLVKEGYLVMQNVWFELDKKMTNKKVSGWSDIDILAIKTNEILLIQCKSFLGDKKHEDTFTKIITHFNNATVYLNNSPYQEWLPGKTFRKICVVDTPVQITVQKLKENGIEIWLYEDLLIKILQKLQKEQEKMNKKGRIGKEDDLLLRVLTDLIRRDFIKKEKLQTS